MKRLSVILITILISFNSFAHFKTYTSIDAVQNTPTGDSAILATLTLKANIIEALIPFMTDNSIEIEDIIYKWKAKFRINNSPNGNQNVVIDSVSVREAASIYFLALQNNVISDLAAQIKTAYSTQMTANRHFKKLIDDADADLVFKRQQNRQEGRIRLMGKSRFN